MPEPVARIKSGLASGFMVVAGLVAAGVAGHNALYGSAGDGLVVTRLPAHPGLLLLLSSSAAALIGYLTVGSLKRANPELMRTHKLAAATNNRDRLRGMRGFLLLLTFSLNAVLLVVLPRLGEDGAHSVHALLFGGMAGLFCALGGMSLWSLWVSRPTASARAAGSRRSRRPSGRVQ